MTSMRRSSCLAAWRLRSRTSTFVATAAPASRQTHAAARSSGPPRCRKVPDRGQAATRPFYDKSTRSQCNEGSGGAELTHALQQAEARGGDSAESARTSLSKGDSPSTLAVLEIGKESKLAAKDLAAATDNNPDHRPTTLTQRMV